MLFIEIRFAQLLSVDEHFAVSYFDRFAGQADYPFYIAFVGIVRKPKYDDVAALDVTPAHALKLVIDELIDQETLAVVKLREHRCTLDYDRLDKKHAKKHEDNDYQKNVTSQPKCLSPETLARFAPQPRHLDIAIVRDGNESEIRL